MQPVIPWYVAPIVLAMVVALASWLSRLVYRAAEAAELDPATRRRVRLGAGFFLGGWLFLALLLARSTPATDAAGNGVVPLSFPLFLGGSLIVAIGLLAFSPTWRRVVDAIPAESLISVQIYRLIGGIFLPLYAIGSLPRHFALPSAYGDIAVGLAAPFVAMVVSKRLRSARALALGWNIFGFLDLLAAVGLGTGYLIAVLRGGVEAPPTAAAMTFLPLVLIPTFAVPLGVILHIYSIRRTLRSEAAVQRRSGGVRAAVGPASSRGAVSSMNR
jgi:hypothetical protein